MKLTEKRVKELLDLLRSKNCQYKFIESAFNDWAINRCPDFISETDKADLIELSKFIQKYFIVETESIIENPLEEYKTNNHNEDYDKFLEDWSNYNDYYPDLDYTKPYDEIYRDYFYNILPEQDRICTYDFLVNKTSKDFVLYYVDNFEIHYSEICFWNEVAKDDSVDNYNDICKIAELIADFYNSSIITLPKNYTSNQYENEIYDRILGLCRNLPKDTVLKMLEDIKNAL
jgi:hypothetical protein